MRCSSGYRWRQAALRPHTRPARVLHALFPTGTESETELLWLLPPLPTWLLVLLPVIDKRLPQGTCPIPIPTPGAPLLAATCNGTPAPAEAPAAEAPAEAAIVVTINGSSSNRSSSAAGGLWEQRWHSAALPVLRVEVLFINIFYGFRRPRGERGAEGL